MMDVDGVTESLRKRVAELQGKLEVEMATAAQLPDALDQVHQAAAHQGRRAGSHGAAAGF